MNLLAIVGSPRKGKSTDTLVNHAIQGVQANATDVRIKKIHLMDHEIKFCTNCLACRDSKTTGPMAKCAIRDDMDTIREDLLQADIMIFGTPVHMGYATGIMMTFLERVCWTFAKPERTFLTVKGCPRPRSDRKRKAITIVTSGIVPPLYQKFCNWAAGQIKTVVRDSLNGKIVGTLYAGDIEHRGVARYHRKAFRLGQRLV